MSSLFSSLLVSSASNAPLDIHCLVAFSRQSLLSGKKPKVIRSNTDPIAQIINEIKVCKGHDKVIWGSCVIIRRCGDDGKRGNPGCRAPQFQHLHHSSAPQYDGQSGGHNIGHLAKQGTTSAPQSPKSQQSPFTSYS